MKLLTEPFFDGYARMYDLMRALEDHLEATPESEFALQLNVDTERDYWLIETGGFHFDIEGDLPAVTLIYYFDDRTVTFYNIKITPP